MNIWELLRLVFTDYTLRNVALGAAILGTVSGVLGSFAVLRKQSLFGDAMSHAALPGVVVAFILTGQKTPIILMLGAIGAGWLGALTVMVILNQTRIKQDSALGIVLAVFFGFGLVLLTWVQHQGSASQSGLDKFLFGRAAALIAQDVVTMGLLGLASLVLVALFWKEFKLLSFDPHYAASLGLPVQRLDILLTTLLVVAIVIGLQTVGVVLMSAMVVAPAAAARQWTDRLGRMVLLSALFGAAAGVGGAMISSLTRNMPTGPTVVLVISALVLVSLFLAPNRGLLWARLRRARNRRRLQRAAVLRALYAMGLHHQDPRYSHTLRSLRAALPGRGVLYTLERLSGEGLVEKRNGDQWALTVAGVENVEALQRQQAAAEETAAPGGGVP